MVRSSAGLAAVALVAAGSWAAREPIADLLADLLDRATPSITASARQPVVTVTQAPVDQRNTPTLNSAMPPVAPTTGDSLVVAVADGALAVADTVQWTPAVARTWVNVRYDASKGSDVVGVIKPSEKAMLGEYGRGGWRQVKSPEVSGWVDPRHFEADSLRSRG